MLKIFNGPIKITTDKFGWHNKFPKSDKFDISWNLSETFKILLLNMVLRKMISDMTFKRIIFFSEKNLQNYLLLIAQLYSHESVMNRFREKANWIKFNVIGTKRFRTKVFGITKTYIPETVIRECSTEQNAF